MKDEGGNEGGTRNHHERDMPFVSMHILLALSDTKEVRGEGGEGVCVCVCVCVCVRGRG